MDTNLLSLKIFPDQSQPTFLGWFPLLAPPSKGGIFGAPQWSFSMTYDITFTRKFFPRLSSSLAHFPYLILLPPWTQSPRAPTLAMRYNLSPPNFSRHWVYLSILFYIIIIHILNCVLCHHQAIFTLRAETVSLCPLPGLKQGLACWKHRANIFQVELKTALWINVLWVTLYLLKLILSYFANIYQLNTSFSLLCFCHWQWTTFSAHCVHADGQKSRKGKKKWKTRPCI